MSNFLINASIPVADLTAIETKIGEIKTLLPFLLNLTPDERFKLRKKGSKRAGYVNDVYDGLSSNPNVLPAAFNMGNFTRDKVLDTDLSHVRDLLVSLKEGIDDTLMQLGAELMKQSDSDYDYLKRAAKDNSSLQEIVERIGRAFEGQGRRSEEPAPTP